MSHRAGCLFAVVLAVGLSAAGCGTAAPDRVPDVEVPVPAVKDAPKQEKAGPAQTRPIDLETALRLAVASHYDILETRARLEEAHGVAESALGELFPTLGLVAGAGRTDGTIQG
ncbi:MAG: hypothetical protein ACYTAF_12400, partial [Planctomycetota bacterium]